MPPSGNPSIWGIHDTQGFGSRQYSGCGWYRIALPFDQLKAHGWDASYGPTLDPETDPDIIVGQRLDRPDAVPYWRALGEHYKTVYEVDDNPFALDPVNWLARPAYENEAMRQAIREHAAAAHLVTVTTGPLAEVFGEFNSNVAVLPNRIPAFLLELERKRHEKLTIGWMGGVSHGRDLAMIAQVWRDAVDETGSRGHFVGADFTDMLRPHGFEVTGWVADPAECFAAIDFDIALAPLSDHPFNDFKSAIKVLEYAALGIPVIASDHPVYAGSVIDGVTGFLCRTRSEWRTALRMLTSNASWRTEMGAAAREHVRHLTVEEGWQQWAGTYSQLSGRSTPCQTAHLSQS